MTQEHLVTPPPELVREWQIKIEYCSRREDRETFVSKVFQLGADHELEACVGYVDTHVSGNRARALREARRPKPPSLKEQALEALDEEQAEMSIQNYKVIRSVLESLPD
jgi:hypothetical protein